MRRFFTLGALAALALAATDPSDAELEKELAAWEASPNGQYAKQLGLVPKTESITGQSDTSEKLRRWKAKKAMLPIYAARNPHASFTMNTPFALVTKDEANRRLDADIDWTTSGCIHPVQNQGACGSCWAFAATATIEAANCLAGRGLVKLSEQDLVSCSGAAASGYPALAIDYAARNGVCLLKDYPYISGGDGTVHDCVSSCTKQNVNVDTYVYVYGESSYLSVMQAQPVAVFLYAGEEFMAYKGRTAGFTQSSSQCSTLQTNTDYYGYDIKSTQRASADLCCDDCKNTPGCQLFVWFQGTCYLKNAKGAQSTKPGATAGFVNFSGPTCGAVEANTDYPGQDLYTARLQCLQLDARRLLLLEIVASKPNSQVWRDVGSCQQMLSSRARRRLRPEAVLGFEPQNESQGWLHSWNNGQLVVPNPNWVCDRATKMRQNIPNKDILILSGGGTDYDSCKLINFFQCPAVDVVSIHTYADANLNVLQQFVDLTNQYNERVVVEEFG
ncbi:hypothetical protein Ae201684_012734 [Aphanomyces euteiches]|uniref:Apple domain-containing protein n=1 Tax=Aphanomyces euteiches TaxID=100861 RepID=A0A6G0WQI2_9STRA|nr:hypothetical protein Ae201684_012734 [Aphanomyces euteiches]